MRYVLFSAVAVFLGILSGLLPGNPAYAGEAKVRLNFAAVYNSRHPLSQSVFFPWIEKLRERSNGRLEVVFYEPGKLVREEDAFAAVRDGNVDIGAFNLSHISGMFPVHEVVELPFMLRDSQSASRLLWTLRKQFQEFNNEMRGVKPLAVWVSPPTDVHSTTTPVLRLEDLYDRWVLVWTGPTAEAVRVVGAHPEVVIPRLSAEILQKSQHDTLVCPLVPVRSNKLNEKVRHTTRVGLNAVALGVFMNPAALERMPEDLRAIFLESVQGLEERCARVLDETVDVERKALLAEGHTFHAISDAEKQRWLKAMAPVRDLWVREQEAYGNQRAQDILAEAERMAREF